MQSWLRDPGPGALAAIAGGVVVILAAIAMLLRRRRRRAARMQAERVRDEAAFLKDQLRQRLSEPASLLAGGINTAPTMGASEAFEGDIEAAAKTVLVEAGGHRAKARQLLRKRMNGHGAANGKLNGSEVGYWRQLGALSLLDGIYDALPAYARAADLAPENAEAQMLVGVLHLRAGNLAAAESAFRRQIKLGDAGNGSTDAGLARYRGHTMLGDVLAARGDHEEAMAAYAEAQREVKALLERDAEHAACGAICPSRTTASATCMRPRRSSMRHSKAIAGASRSPRPWLRAIPRARCGSTISPSATIASAICWRGRATAKARSKASARAWRSPRRSSRAIPATRNGNGTLLPATTASGMR
jgi:tetratricopeptide (TPR) repeat protein